MYTTNEAAVYIRDGRSWGLSNEFKNVFDLYDAIEDSESAEQLKNSMNAVAINKHWNIDRDTTAYTRFTNPDRTLFLIIKKA